MIFNPIFLQDYLGASQSKPDSAKFQSANYLFANIINVYDNNVSGNQEKLLENKIGKNLFALADEGTIKVSEEELTEFFGNLPSQLQVVKSKADASVSISAGDVFDNKLISVEEILKSVDSKGKIELLSSDQPTKTILITRNDNISESFANEFSSKLLGNQIISVPNVDEGESESLTNKNSSEQIKSFENILALLNKIKNDYVDKKFESKSSNFNTRSNEGELQENAELLELIIQVSNELDNIGAANGSLNLQNAFKLLKEIKSEIEQQQELEIEVKMPVEASQSFSKSYFVVSENILNQTAAIKINENDPVNSKQVKVQSTEKAINAETGSKVELTDLNVNESKQNLTFAALSLPSENESTEIKSELTDLKFNDRKHVETNQVRVDSEEKPKNTKLKQAGEDNFNSELKINEDSVWDFLTSADKKYSFINRNSDNDSIKSAPKIPVEVKKEISTLQGILKTKIELMLKQINDANKNEDENQKLPIEQEKLVKVKNDFIINNLSNIRRTASDYNFENRTIKISEQIDILKTEMNKKDMMTTNETGGQKKYSIHIIENRVESTVNEIKSIKATPVHNYLDESKNVEMSKNHFEKISNVSFNKKLVNNYDFMTNGVKSSKVTVNVEDLQSENLIYNNKENPEIYSVEDKSSEVKQVLVQSVNLKMTSSGSHNQNSIQQPEKPDYNINTIETVAGNYESENGEAALFSNTKNEGVNERNSAIHQNDILVQKQETVNNKKPEKGSELMKQKEVDNQVANKYAEKGDYFDKQNPNQEKGSAESVIKQNPVHEKPLDFVRELKNNLNQISEDVRNQSTEVVKTIQEYELKNELKNLFNNNESRNVTLKLTPENLGKVNVNIDIQENQMNTKISVDSESVKSIIQNTANELKNSLNQNGIQLVSITVSMNNADEKGNSKHTSKAKRKVNEIDEAMNFDETLNDNKTKKLGYNTYDYIM